MESFTLGPTPKIDFSCSTAIAHLQWLQRELITSLRELIPNSCSSKCPEASIYRLRSNNGRLGPIRTVDMSRPDWQLCDKIFWEFLWKSFLFESRDRTVRHSRLDSCTSAASNFQIGLHASWPCGMNVGTAILQHAISISTMCASGLRLTDIWTVEVELAISLTVERASGSRQTNVRTVILELWFLP